jgi:hypothetical protein
MVIENAAFLWLLQHNSLSLSFAPSGRSLYRHVRALYRVDVARRSRARAPCDLSASLGSNFIGTWILPGLFNSMDN